MKSVAVPNGTSSSSSSRTKKVNQPPSGNPPVTEPLFEFRRFFLEAVISITFVYYLLVSPCCAKSTRTHAETKREKIKHKTRLPCANRSHSFSLFFPSWARPTRCTPSGEEKRRVAQPPSTRHHTSSLRRRRNVCVRLNW